MLSKSKLSKLISSVRTPLQCKPAELTANPWQATDLASTGSAW